MKIFLSLASINKSESLKINFYLYIGYSINLPPSTASYRFASCQTMTKCGRVTISDSDRLGLKPPSPQWPLSKGWGTDEKSSAML